VEAVDCSIASAPGAREEIFEAMHARFEGPGRCGDQDGAGQGPGSNSNAGQLLRPAGI
jgi:hypothetical protein